MSEGRTGSCRPASTQLTETRLEVWTTVLPFTFMKGSAKAAWSATTPPRRAKAAYGCVSRGNEFKGKRINTDVIRQDLSMSHSHNEDPYSAGSALPRAVCLLSVLLWCHPHQTPPYVDIHEHHLFLHHSCSIWLSKQATMSKGWDETQTILSGLWIFLIGKACVWVRTLTTLYVGTLKGFTLSFFWSYKKMLTDSLAGYLAALCTYGK